MTSVVAGEFAAAVSAVADLTSAGDAGVSDVELAARLVELTRLRAVVDAALVERLAVFDARAAARYDGQTSTLAWLRSRLRITGWDPDGELRFHRPDHTRLDLTSTPRGP